AVIVTIATLYFLYVAFSLESYERKRKLVSIVLIIESIIFYSLYFQMTTTLTFLSQQNGELSVLGWHVTAAQSQFLNP
ncbi:MFS transporter, partial [Francisella tularensis subsp. holarctica]|nr:MFS transporter [Francisella tularensis subsp. holarctica]